MLNLDVGTEKIINGHSHILTHAGSDGHAIYGPYDRLEPGRLTGSRSLRKVKNA